MDEPNNLALTRVVWLSMSKHDKTSFLKENSTLIFDDAANNMHLIPETGSVCMVCVVEALSQDPSAANSTHKLVNILNRFMGKTWSKPSKRKKHCVTRNHAKVYFCSTKRNVAKTLQLWKLGLQNIGGIYCKLPGTWTSDRLQN